MEVDGSRSGVEWKWIEVGLACIGSVSCCQLKADTNIITMCREKYIHIQIYQQNIF